jgi:hypothetical protein
MSIQSKRCATHCRFLRAIDRLGELFDETLRLQLTQHFAAGTERIAKRIG